MISLFLCSPRENGTTDHLGATFAMGCGANLIALRDYAIQPCLGCNECHKNDGRCLIQKDDCAQLFELLQTSSSVVFVSPIYFYALPAHFKAFIDRSQPFWHKQIESKCPAPPGGKKAAVILAAGRPRGQKLFSGALLTLKWFLKPFGFRIEYVETYRGLENPRDLLANPDLLVKLADKGRAFAAYVQSAKLA